MAYRRLGTTKGFRHPYGLLEQIGDQGLPYFWPGCSEPWAVLRSCVQEELPRAEQCLGRPGVLRHRAAGLIGGGKQLSNS